MQRVRRGERVVHRVPVAEVVLHVEAHDPQRRRVGERATELFGCASGSEGVEDRADDLLGILVEEPPGEAGDVVVLAEARAALGLGGRQRRLGAPSEAQQVMRMTPLGELLGALRARGLAYEGGQHQRGRVGADVAEGFERLVREVERVALRR